MTFDQIMQKENFVPNAEQRMVIDSTINTVVSAGAGAGKTAVLSWRFLKLVMDCGARPDQILTLTFTKKAANEMQERIYKRLLEAKDSLPEDTLKWFGNASISTLDSFCAQIVRSDCISYGLPRDVSNLSDSDLDEMARRLGAKFLSDPDNSEMVEAIAPLFMPATVMKDFFCRIAAMSNITDDYNAQKVSQAFLTDIKAMYKKRRDFLFQKFNYLKEEYELKGVFLDQFKTMSEHLENESFGPDDYFILVGVKDEGIKDTVEEIRTVLSKDSGYYLLQNLAKKDVLEVSILQKAIEKYVGMLNDEKRHRGLLCFNDVTELAVCILRDNLKVREVFKSRFRYIMIDEFQDNNSKQRDLLFLIAEKAGIGTAGHIPSIDEIDDSKLFFVGDEKQSIYKFRGAEVSVFRKLQDEISKNGNSLSLSMNYRSQASLIDHFNSVFEKILEKDGKDFSARYSAIGAGRKSDNTLSKIIFASYDKNRLNPVIEADVHEAEIIADYCYRAIYTDEFMVDGKRPKPEDIAIIFRTSSNQMNIEKALKSLGIPYQITEAKSLTLEAVSSDFYSFLNCLLYPEDDRSRFALLRSPFCGLCDESLVRLERKGLEVCEVDVERYQQFLQMFENLRIQAFRMTIPQLLETLYVDFGYKAYLEESEANRSFIEHYEYLYSYAVKFESEGKGLSDYARFLRRNLGVVKKIPEISVLHRESKGVQIMTVHKSKGLEFKVVIFSGLGAGRQYESDQYVFKYNDSLIASEDRHIQSLLETDELEKENAEFKRVMYVALTRARDHLILVGGYRYTEKNGMKSGILFEWYSQAIGFVDPKSGCKKGEVTLEDFTSFELPVRRIPGTTGKRHDDSSACLSSFGNRINRLSVTNLEAQHKDNNYTYDYPLPTYPVDEIISRDGLHDKFGTLCHYVLECLVGTGSYADVRCDVSTSDSTNEMLLNQAKVFADGFVLSDLYSSKVCGHETRQEVRFYTCQENPEDPVLEGVIDLLVLGEDYNLVIDYKSDSYRNPEQHKLQVLTYIKAAEELFGKKCYGTLFYLRDSSAGEYWNRAGEVVEL